ncbi:MAG TPA: TIGR00282 family metallophosphoesterase [Clostridiales bacterium]|nr:TIGR00282 family metallophosphoesterase [Clostridiales bacterium]
MHILFIGDLVGSDGRKILKARLPEMKKNWQIDVCIANAENAAAGLGLTASLAREIKACGVDLLTMGNHTWSKYELLQSASDISYLVRPANVPVSWPGQGYAVINHPAGRLLVINLLGRVFMDQADDPFATVDQLLNRLKKEQAVKLVVVDFHAEATSEKNAMAWFLDGRVTLLAGTHTHIQTADERILERGTAFITDVGMTGPVDGVIGMEKQSSLRRFVDRLPAPYEVARGRSALCAVYVEADPATGQAVRIERIRIDE